MITSKPLSNHAHPTRRLPARGKAMTLVAAFRGIEGGILLCSDREWTDGFSKREVDKIYRIRDLAACEIFIAGSGPDATIHKASVDIFGAFVRASKAGKDVLQEHKSILESSLKAVYKQCAKTLRMYPMCLLIVVAPRGGKLVPMLYRTDEDVLVPESFYAASGSGKPIADYFADRLYEYGKLTKDALKVVAAFIFREAEASSAGVGLGVDMRFIHEGDRSIHFIPSSSVKAIQVAIPSLSEAIQSYWAENLKIPPEAP